MNKKNHLPLYGVGPIIVYGQFVFTVISIILTYISNVKFPTKVAERIIQTRIYFILQKGEQMYSMVSKEKVIL